MDKVNGEEEINHEIEQWFSKIVLGSLYFFEMILFTELQYIKLIKAKQFKWKARWTVHQFRWSRLRDGHNILTDKETSSLGDREEHTVIKRVNWFGYQFGFRENEPVIGHLVRTLQRGSLERKLRFHLGVTCLLSNL